MYHLGQLENRVPSRVVKSLMCVENCGGQGCPSVLIQRQQQVVTSHWMAGLWVSNICTQLRWFGSCEGPRPINCSTQSLPPTNCCAKLLIEHSQSSRGSPAYSMHFSASLSTHWLGATSAWPLVPKMALLHRPLGPTFSKHRRCAYLVVVPIFPHVLSICGHNGCHRLALDDNWWGILWH